MTGLVSPAYSMRGVRNAKRAARATGRTRKGDKHESHTARYNWVWRNRNAATSAAISRPDLIAEYNAKLGV